MNNELTEDDLERATGGIPYEVAREMALENDEVYRRNQLEELLKEQEENNKENTGRVR